MIQPDRGALEAALESALAVHPSQAGLARLDDRVRAALAARAGERRSPSWLSGRRLALAVLVIVAVVTGAAGGLRMLERLAENHPGWERAWERAERVGIARTSSGHTVILERAYVDGNLLLLGVTADGYQPTGYELRIDGRPVESGFSQFSQRKDQSAALWVSEAPRGLGRSARLDLDIRQLARDGRDRDFVEGSWRFELTLANAGGSTWRGPVSVTKAGVTATLDEVSISSTMVRGHLRFRGERLGDTDDTWSPLGYVIRGDKRVRLGTGYGLDNEFTFTTRDGYDARTGTWRIRLDTLSADLGPDRGTSRIEGPWEFEVSID